MSYRFLASDFSYGFFKCRFDLNLVYTTRSRAGCPSDLGPRPTVAVSTRYALENGTDYVEWTPMLVYTATGKYGYIVIVACQ